MTTTTAATRPDDDLGLAGRGAIVTGGGAAGDGIGNGRAACILLARSGRDTIVSYPVPNSPSAGVGRARAYRAAGGNQWIIAAGR